MSSKKKKKFLPIIRFPEYQGTDGWKVEKLSGLVTTIAPPQKLPSALYQKEGAYPVIDQSKNYICGWTDNADALISDNLPLIIFGDHTCSLKFVNQPFAQGADGIKILSTKSQVTPEFLYQSLFFNPVRMSSYKRHFSVLKDKLIALPKVETGEQQKIADFLFSIDELINLECQKFDGLKLHKNGLMQQLFPAKGETVPRKRFPEFKQNEKWKKKAFSKLFEIGGGKNYKHLSKGETPVYGSGGYMLSVNDYLYDGESACIGRKGTIDKPMLLTGKFWTVDTLFYTHSFKGCLPKFVYLLFQNINWLTYNEAGGVPSLSKVIINKIEVLVPDIDEQEKIVEFIFGLEDLIAKQTKKIETLKLHKKGLMQQLFPVVEEVM